MEHREERYMASIALLAAFLIASHGSISNGSGASGIFAFIGTYVYWLIRIAVQSLIFFGVRSVIRTYFGRSFSMTKMTAFAILASHIPFVLTVTAMDIVLGYPELGLEASAGEGQLRIAEFFWETLYLFDNHVSLCLLLAAPGWILSLENAGQSPQSGENSGTFLSNLEPPLVGRILWVEAQEHYVRITTSEETRMVLARFSDIVRELSEMDGQQVHRSHWVARAAIEGQKKNGQRLSLLLNTGDAVPVSRSFKSQLAIIPNAAD